MTIDLRIILATVFVGFASSSPAEQLSFFGTSGLIDTPNASMLQDGNIALTSGFVGTSLRNTFTFQISPRFQGAFRYTRIENFDAGGTQDRFDRSFDVSYLLRAEDDFWPAIAVGIRDLGGTGTFSSEYIVGTKRIHPDVVLTAGLGWGRLGSRNGFRNPFALIADEFSVRPASNVGGINTTGRLDGQVWFRGDAAVFGGLTWEMNEQLTVIAEYSSDTYALEERRGVFSQNSPINVGFRYSFDSGLDFGLHYLYGSEIGATLSYTIDPADAKTLGGAEIRPPAIQPRSRVAAASWNFPQSQQSVSSVLAAQIDAQGLALESMTISGNVAAIRVVNNRYGAEAQALGRTARVMANTLPPSVSIFDVTFVRNGLALSTMRIRRRDLEELEHDVDGAWLSYARSEISDAFESDRSGELPGIYPRFDYHLGYFLAASYFDPQSPIRLEYGPKLSVTYSLQPGLNIAGQIRYPLGGNIGSATRASDSVLPHVRSDAVRYAQESELELSYLTAEYVYRPAPDIFGRVTVGYLERMYGGVSAEILWHPVDSRLALGAELNYAVQRDFDLGLGFQDYDVITGHASAYYDHGNGYHSQLDVGRYLAGDWGATLSLDREFNNGFRVGAFMTLTDVPFAQFGEGSFDKGIRFEIPLSWLSGRPSRQTFGQTIRPIQRDGGARLSVRNRLYFLTRDYREPELEDQWGRFWE